MKDKVKPINFGQGMHKTLHGHAKLELFNAKTGEREQVVEQDNLVTVAIDRLINSLVWEDHANNYVFPLATNGLGALMMFDGDLEESETNVIPPGNVGLTGYAYRDTNTADTKRGSLNSAETMALTNGYQSVWDFSTSQANGVIKSLSLCNKNVSIFKPVTEYDSDKRNLKNTSGGDIGNTFLPIWHDGEYCYFITTGNSNSYDKNTGITTFTVTINIYKERIPLHKYKVADAYNTVGLPSLVKSYSWVWTDTGNLGSTYNPMQACQLANDGYVYWVYPKASNSSGDATFYWFRLKVSDLSFEPSEVHTETLANTFIAGGANASYANGKFYFIKNNSRGYYIADADNLVNVVEVTLPDGYYVCTNGELKYRLGPKTNGGCYTNVYCAAANGQSGYYDMYEMILQENGQYTIAGTYSRQIVTYREVSDSYRIMSGCYFYDYMYAWGWPNSNYYGSRGQFLQYLGTICNLSTEITKNASQTLKVTYTLTNVEDTNESSN